MFLLCVISTPALAREQRKTVIYGSDTRVEALESHDPMLVDYSFSVAGLVREYDLFPAQGKGSFELEEDLKEEVEKLRGKVDRETYNFLLSLLESEENEEQKKEDEEQILALSRLKSIKKLKGRSKNLLRYFLYRLTRGDYNGDVFKFDDNQSVTSVFNACPNERFAEQTVLPQCTGFLVKDDVLLTAGHCLKTVDDCRNSLWVFEYYKGANAIPARNVFKCKEILAHKESLKKIFTSKLTLSVRDYTLVRLDRKAKGRKPLKIRTKGRGPLKGEKLAVIGHPLGLPMKIATGEVTSSFHWSYFKTNLDTFFGNSGSPVINLKTGEVEGLLFDGENDYIEDKSDDISCRKTNVLSRSKGDEKVLRISKVPTLK
ncbi:trypsin-like serine peptidase [Halobacteriovorax sp. GB3]|uniref:trypsin-like serine peptidase n=1 Tax=Halobacteriovorax sp. GB3 TaxID=2719615 RepID=UPI00235F221B|nr:serine protease [Halobacteriovorax sp. GB3]